jgi:Aspartyl protease
MGADFIALRTVPVVLKNGDTLVSVNALLDDGSTRTYLNADVAAQLGLVGNHESVKVSVLNGKYEVFQTMSVEVQLQSLDGNISIPLVALTTENVTSSHKVVDWRNNCWPHLCGINFLKVAPTYKVDMLIGIDYADLHFARKEVRGRPGQPIARLTPLGWTCKGKPSSEMGARTHFSLIHTYLIR